MPEPTLLERLRSGEWVTVGTKIYALCFDCGDVIRVNKPMIGSLHVCTPRGDNA